MLGIGKLICYIRRKRGGRHRYRNNFYGDPKCVCGRFQKSMPSRSRNAKSRAEKSTAPIETRPGQVEPQEAK